MQIQNSLKQLFIVCALLVSGLYVSYTEAQTVVYETAVTVTPGAPTAGQSIIIVASGVFPSGCAVVGTPSVTQDGPIITLTSEYLPVPPDEGCTAALYPFSYTVNFGPLPEGSYNVVWVLTNATPTTVLATTSFSVTGPVGIPTLSEWSLLVLTLTLGLISVRRLYSDHST